MAVSAAPAHANGATGNAAVSTQVSLTGQLYVTGDRRQQEMILTAAATDSNGWQMKATLTPAQIARDGASALLTGRYTLAETGTPILDGDISGQVNLVNGQGTLQLTLPDGTQLQAAFGVGRDNSLQLNLSGNLPQPAPPTAMPANGSPFFWYLSRTSGLVAYVLLFVNVCLGLGVRTGFLDATLARWRSFDLHQATALLAMALVVLHVFSLLGDQFIGFTPRQLLVPGLSTYSPFWIGVGIVAFYALALVIPSFWLRRFIGHRAWRALHDATFILFFASLAHGVFAGSDTQAWTKLIYWCTGAGALILTLARFWGPWSAGVSGVRSPQPSRHVPAQ